jgi:nitrogen regulatory protein PII
MLHMVVLIVARSEQLDAVVEAWQRAGTQDITIMESKSLMPLRDRGRRDDLPLFPSLADIFENEEFDHFTLFAIVEEEQIDRLIEAAEQHLGDLDHPGNGALAALPVSRVKGVKQ